MVTTIIVVDSLIDDVLYNTLSFLKKTSCYIVKLDLYSVTKENIHVKLHEYIAEEMESQIMNISKILFVNFNINENNIETELFLGEKSKLFNLETHDSSFKSWNFVNEIVVNLSKSFLIENVDFLDINHLIFYNSYKAPLKHVEEAASINESFKANVNYLTKYVTSEESEILKTSTNWLNTLLGPMYSQNVQLKEFIDLYFQVNNSNLNFLANQNIEYLDIFSKKFVEIKQNNVLLNETTTSVNVMLIPLQLYGEDGDKLLDVIEMVKKDTCYICFINEEDDVETINKILSNIANTACNFSSGTSIDMNLCIHVDYASIKNGQFDLAEEIPTIDLNNSSTANTLVSILDSLNNNSKLKSVKASITNIYESAPEKSLLFCEELMSNYQDGKVTFILERTRNTYDDILYKPEEFASLSFISHQEIYSENNVTKDINVPFLLNFINESSYDDFVTKTTLNQLILYDASLSKFLPEVYASLTPDTEILVYHPTETFSILKDKISQLKNNYGSSLNNVALFKKNMPSTHFSLFEEEKSLKYDVLEDSSEWNDELIIDPSGEDDVSLQELDVSMEEDAHNAETIYPEGHLEQEKEIYYSHYNGPDPSLNTWQKFSDFLSYLQDDIEVSNFDILTCKLVGPDWEYILETLQEKTPNMTIHSSIDTTGHVLFEGDWILETPKNVNLVGLYFNKNIYDVKVELDSTVFSSMYTLHLKIRDYIKVSTHQSVVDDVGDISTWIIHSNLKTFRDGNRGLFYYAIYTTGDYKIEKDWSKLDGISGWDVSHMTDFDGAFAGPGSHGLINNYNAKFNSPIGSWDVANVTNMSSAFYNAVLFDQDLSEWDTIKVGNMKNMFYNAWSFNHDISGWNVSNVTTLDSTFYAARRFNQSLAGWDTANVTNMNFAFHWARSFDQDLSTWDVGNVTQFQYTFVNARSFTQVLGGSWKNVPPQVQDNTITNGIHTKYMFCGSNDDFKNIPTGHIEVDYDPAVGFTSLNQLKRAFYIDAINSLYAESLFGKMRDWDVSKITSLDGLCGIVNRTYHTIEMEDWNVSNVTSMEKTFYNKGYFQCDLRKWDTANVTNMKQMFYNCSRFNSDISGWDTTNVTDMTQMFYNCQRLRYDLTSWDTTNADTTNMFQNATYYNDSIINSTFVPNYSLPFTTFTTKSELTTAVNAWKTNRVNAQNTYGHISKWNVSAVTDFSSLFTGIGGAIFHENLNEWETSNVTDMTRMFYNCTNVSVLINEWTTSNVTSLNNAFYSCYYFIDDLSGWDVGNVTDMDSTFMYALSFNGNIEGWEVGKVTTMYNMFHTANYFNRDLTSWDIENVTQFRSMFTNAQGINRVFKGKWMDLTERLPTASLLGMVGTVYRGDHRLGIGFKNNGANMNSIHKDVLRQNLKLYVINKKAALLHYPEISQWNISNIDNFDNLLHSCYAVTLDISGWDVSHVTSMNYTFLGNNELDIDFSSWNVDNVKSFVNTFDGCKYSEIKGVEEWTMQSATNIASMFAKCHLFNRDVSSWNVTKTTSINGMFSDCKYFNKDLSKWKLESMSVWSGVYRAFRNTYNYNVVLGQTWTVLHDQINSTDTGSDKTLAQYIAYMFDNTSPGTVSDVPYNAPKITFTSTDVINGSTYVNDEIDIKIVVNNELTGSISSNDLQITNGEIKNNYIAQISSLEYTFVFKSESFGQSSQITTNSSSSLLSEYIVEDVFEWFWSPPATVITFNSPSILNNQTQTSSSIDVEINLSREFLTNEQLIQKEDVSITNGVITGFQRVNDTQYIFTFIASSPNVSSVIEMANHFDASNTTLPNSFSWTWSATIEQPVFTISSVDVNNNETIKKNEIDMLLTYTPNRKLAFASLTETDISFTNGFIVNNSFVKKTPTQYSFRFRSLSRDTNSTIYIPQNQFQYNFVDGATNLTENYEGSSTFTWKYNGLDIPLTNNKTVAVITSEQKESKSLDLILHGNVTYDPVYNEYEFEKSTSDYITISGEVLNGLGEASISFWYKTKTTANTSFATLLTLRNDDNDNYTLQRYSTQDKFHIKSTGSGTINTTTTNLPYYNTNYVHMVVTFTATEILVYKNSVLEETHSVSNIIAGGERTFQMIGASVTSANAVYRYFNGYIKNLRFYNYAIPLTEVSALYTMYNTGMNDTVPQILSVNLTTTDTLSNNEFPKATINMEMDVTYDSVASISSIDRQSFIIDKSNFDTSFGYVFDFKQLSETKVSFKFGASTTIHNSQLFLKQDTITRTINSNLNVVANPESNVFTWKYKSEPLTIQTIKSNIGDTGSLTNQDVIWIQVIFSEEVFNFRKHYITGTNCKVIKTTGSGTRYAVKVQTFRPTGASIVIDIPSSLPITTGKGLNKALVDANNTTYNWQYHNVVPTFTIVTSQESGLTNNADYVDISLVTSTSTTNFDINSLNLNGSAEIVNFSGSGKNYSYRLQPFASSAISLTLPSGAFSDEYGNKNTSSHTFNWTYHNIKPEVYIASQDINSGDSADIGSIETYFVFSKPVSGFTLADVDITNGNLSELTQSTTFPEHENTYTVTVDTKTSSNSYYNRGSSNAFFLNGEEAKVVSFVAGNTYTFNNASNSAHPLKFYTDAEKTSGSEYTTGVTVSATSTIIVVDSNTPTTLYYQCEAHDYMGNIITYGESYKATLIPASSSVTISLEIAYNSVKDDLDIFNDVASNSFVWNYTGTEYMVSIESPDLKSGASHLYKSIQVILTLTYTTFDDVDLSIFTIVNGTVPSILNNGDGTYTFTLESISSNTETSILLPENSVTRSDGNDKNKESNKFTWTYNPPIPKLTLTSSYVKEGAFTNNSSIDLQLDFTEDVVFDVNTINITNASGTLSGSNNSYVLTVVPDVVDDSSADILVSFPEDTGFYNLFDNENLYNDTSYNYSWKYDSVIPTGTIVSSISEFIYQDVCSNIQSVPFTIQFNKNIPSLETNDFTVSSNGALSGLSGSDSLYSFVISALDNTIDNTISFKVGDDAITDEAGNSFSSSNEFSFTITAKVSKVLETAAIAELFTDDADIAEEDKLSSDEINMVLAIEIPDLTVPDFDEVEGGEVSVDISYTVTVDTKTSSNSYYSQGSSSAYYIDGAEALSLALDQDNVYRFNQDDSNNSGHPLLFYEDVDKSVQYTTDISVNGTPGSAGAYTQISITSDTPSTLYYQCGNHGYMGGIITVGEVDTIPVVTLPASVAITNSKVFTRLIDQILEMADDITAIKMSLDDVAMSETATEKIPQVEQVIMAKSNQIEPPVVIEDTGADSVLFVPLANEGDLVKVEINGVAYLTVVNSDNTFSLNIDGVVATGSPFSKDDVYVIDDTNSIIFGSQIISSSPPPQSPPTVDMTSSVVQNGATTTTGTIDIDLSFSTTVEIDLEYIYTLTSDTQITSSSIQSVDGSNSIVVVSVSPILPDVSAELGIVINETTFYSTLNGSDYYNDVSFTFSWNYDATAYNSANVVEVVEEYEPLFINPDTGFIPCFLKDTNILTTKGYKKVQDLIPGKDKLIDHKNNNIECLEVKKYVKQNDGKEYPHRIPCGSQLSKEFICDQDLFLTYNHCIYLPNNDMFAPVSLMKHIKQHVTNDPYFVYYHVFTSNYFSDTIIANGIPCETHSKYAFNYLRGLDSSGKLLKKVMEKTNMLPNCRRNRISRKKYNKLVNKFVKNKNKYRK